MYDYNLRTYFVDCNESKVNQAKKTNGLDDDESNVAKGISTQRESTGYQPKRPNKEQPEDQPQHGTTKHKGKLSDSIKFCNDATPRRVPQRILRLPKSQIMKRPFPAQQQQHTVNTGHLHQKALNRSRNKRL